MQMFGGSINLMSMGGLAVAIGLVIDDAVVVVENIHRRASQGADAVADAVSQLMAPLVSSTLTTVVVFAPLGLLSGVVGQFFRALSLSLSVAVLVSLGLSISVVPLLARWALGRGVTILRQRPDPGMLGARCTRAGCTASSRRPVLAVGVAVLLAASTVGPVPIRSAPASCRRPTRAASSWTT